MFPKAYRLYVYNLIYKKLTGKKIKNDILKVKDSKELFYRAKLDAQMPKHQKRLLKTIKILSVKKYTLPYKTSYIEHFIRFSKGGYIFMVRKRRYSE